LFQLLKKKGTSDVIRRSADVNLCKPQEDVMPAKSKAQQKAAGAALAAKRGEIPKAELKGASRGMYESMTEKELDELATVKRSKLPEHVNND
jgi:hypothetical protein